jgi:hypothetical protein
MEASRKCVFYLFPALLLAAAVLSLFGVRGGATGLVFQHDHVDLGQLDYSVETTVDFPFHNAGPKRIAITKIMTDCRCASAVASTNHIGPREKGTVRVTFKSSHTSGLEAHRIVVLTDSASQRSHVLSISAVVNPQIELIPRAITFGHISRLRDASPRQVSIVSRFLKPAEVLHVSSRVPYIRANLLHASPTQKREIGRLQVQLCGELPAGNFTGTVDIHVRTERGVLIKSLSVEGFMSAPADPASRLREP